jgi:hypothetical protein
MNELTGRARGGRALAEKMSADERLIKANLMVEAKKARKEMPIVINKKDDLNIAGLKIQCAIVGVKGEPIRVLTENGIMMAILGEASGASKRKKKALENEGALVPIFLAPSQLKPFIDAASKDSVLLEKIDYLDGDKVVHGYDARILPVVCDIWLKARESGALQKQQLAKAQKAEVLMRGLAHVGIIALVDEATGYQKDREKDALAKILEAFVAKEIQPYLKTFPADYYEQLFRLYGFEYPPKDKKPQWRPSFFGHITNDVVYNRLAPELLPELKKAASKAERKSKLHQWLTGDLGHPKLREHLASIVSILKLSKTPDQFKENVNLIHPRYGDSGHLDFGAPL